MIDFRVQEEEKEVSDDITEDYIETYRSDIPESIPHSSTPLSFQNSASRPDMSIPTVINSSTKPNTVQNNRNQNNPYRADKKDYALMNKLARTKLYNEISDKDLEKRPNYGPEAQKRRFINLKVNKLANKLYNKQVASNYREMKSDFNAELLYDIKQKLEHNKHKDPNATKSCHFCKNYKLKDIRYNMEKIKPLFDKIYLPIMLKETQVETTEEDIQREEDIKRLEEHVFKIEKQDFIQRSMNQLLYAKINPGDGRLTYE